MSDDIKLTADEAIKQNLILEERLALAKEEAVSAKKSARNSLIISVVAITISLLPYLIDIAKALMR